MTKLVTVSQEPKKAQALFRACMPLMQGQISQATVLGMLQAAGITEQEALQMLANAAAPYASRKLAEIGITAADGETAAAALVTVLQEPEKAQALFRACMPLMQGQISQAAVLGVLQAVDITEQDALQMLANAAAPYASRKLAEIGITAAD